mmetsp:Transcript_119212/g.384925  ORF Transcript_119212/g.384925 Transcript_119212/m.384925 type:complete len:205 (+) Transcript_119212:107-721(+)
MQLLEFNAWCLPRVRGRERKAAARRARSVEPRRPQAVPVPQARQESPGSLAASWLKSRLAMAKVSFSHSPTERAARYSSDVRPWRTASPRRKVCTSTTSLRSTPPLPCAGLSAGEAGFGGAASALALALAFSALPLLAFPALGLAFSGFGAFSAAASFCFGGGGGLGPATHSRSSVVQRDSLRPGSRVSPSASPFAAISARKRL